MALLPIQSVTYFPSPQTQTVSVCMNVYHHIFKNLSFRVSIVKYWLLIFKGFWCLKKEKGYFIFFTLIPLMNSNIMMLVVSGLIIQFVSVVPFLPFQSRSSSVYTRRSRMLA